MPAKILSKIIFMRWFFLCMGLYQMLSAQQKEKVIIPAADGLEVSGYWQYPEQNQPLGVIVLCHQAGANHLEYEEIQSQLADKGYASLAIDQRAGGVFNNKPNETHNKALRKGLSVKYLDAIPDMEAAISCAYDKFRQPIILWGSSYSASLAMVIGCKNNEVKAIIAFSPGEYFGEKYSVRNQLNQCKKPIFVTSSRDETGAVVALVKDLKNVSHFKPTEEGQHGSSALWKSNPSHNEYWEALFVFLKNLSEKK